MAERTGIEWCRSADGRPGATWNPIVGCSVVSPGCTNCYAMRMAARIERMAPGGHHAGTTQPSKGGPVWTGKVALAPDHILLAPLRWRQPRAIFVNSMGDLFHPSVSDEMIDRVSAVMALCPQHVFQILTKRSERMRAYACDPATPRRVWDAANEIQENTLHALAAHGAAWGGETPWPLRNVWLGVSAEDQRRADERLPHLRDTPAVVRLVSAEPLLGPLDLTPWLHWLDWIIVGGESGPGARDMPDPRPIRDQCRAAGVAFYMKQMARRAPIPADLMIREMPR